MAVSSADQQLCATADDIHPDIGAYDLAGFVEYTGCLGIGNIYPQPDSFESLYVTTQDADKTVAETQAGYGNDQMARLVIYPWMKQRRHHNGIYLTLLCCRPNRIKGIGY